MENRKHISNCSVCELLPDAINAVVMIEKLVGDGGEICNRQQENRFSCLLNHAAHIDRLDFHHFF